MGGTSVYNFDRKLHTGHESHAQALICSFIWMLDLYNLQKFKFLNILNNSLSYSLKCRRSCHWWRMEDQLLDHPIQARVNLGYVGNFRLIIMVARCQMLIVFVEVKRSITLVKLIQLLTKCLCLHVRIISMANNISDNRTGNNNLT